jgi:uncharacterized integral membrane protein (TIGR00697 family)
MSTLKLNNKLSIALVLYITALISSNTLGIKLMPFFFGTHLSVAIFAFPLVFLMTDIVGEVYGKKMSKFFVWMGFFSLVVFLGFNIISNAMPFSTDFYMKTEYDAIFGLSLRFTIASLVAYIIGEYQDVFSFFFFRSKIGSKHFWLRSNLSNVWGQLVDTSIWTIIAFSGVYPFSVIVSIILPWWLLKVGMGILYTPLSYLGVRWLRDGK